MRSYAFSTLPCSNWSVEQLVETCVTLGFTGIELREEAGSLISLDMDVSEAVKVARFFHTASIQITNIGSGICVKGTEVDHQALNQLKDAARLASYMNAGGVRIFLGNFAQRRDIPLQPIDHAGIVHWLQQACTIAEAYGTEVWVETHNEYAVGSMLRKLLEDVNHPACKVIYDIIHPLEDGEHPAQTIKLLGDRCAHIHIKDGVPPQDPLQHDWIYTKVGEGSLPIGEIVQTLEQEGYRGFYSLEWETKWRKELQQLAIEPEIIFHHYIDFMNKISR
ncbi:TIM barrel protein [Paenibacillus sp. LMG 31461]|uniref:TIM barrel protein n=1 Tax=Paenibacillus plantarum TaxID=2654975 RepID=A0ABX1XG05_9BACL|nr:sugar phosphate isomerase/epimerase [Paenibacillus plantarum]NOU67071.1 TIM barrel protein [Paenibacillus plantarum]